MRWHRYKCGKLSWNIVPNVYNSLQNSFLSLAWPWQVGHSPRGTSGSAGTLGLSVLGGQKGYREHWAPWSVGSHFWGVGGVLGWQVD